MRGLAGWHSFGEQRKHQVILEWIVKGWVAKDGNKQLHARGKQDEVQHE